MNCTHGLPLAEHCDDCMRVYFAAIYRPVDEVAYRAMRQKASETIHEGPDPEFNAAVADLCCASDGEANDVPQKGIE